MTQFPSEEPTGLTDRNLLMGLFSAMGALAFRLTGERLVVELTCGENETVWLFASPLKTIWLKNPPEKPTVAVDEDQYARLLKDCHRLREQRYEEHGDV